MNHDEARTRLLDAAEALFYERGIQAVGMDEIRATSGVSLKRLYQCFGSKQELVAEYLYRRDGRWRASLADYVTRHADTPEARPAAVFDWLAAWFAEPGFRGCAFINSFGELGAVSPAVVASARHHKHAVREYLLRLAQDIAVSDPAELAEQWLFLMDGALTTAAIIGDHTAAHRARRAALSLLRAAQNERSSTTG